MHAGQELVPVGGVEQDAVRGQLHPFGAELLDLGGRVGQLVGREPQLEDLGGGVAGDELARGALGGDHAVVHHDQPVAQLLGLVHVVGGEDQRHAALLEPEQPVPDDVPGLRVEAGGGLVQDEDVRVVDEAPGDGQAALHPARQRVDLVPGPLGELDEVEQLVGPLVDQLARQAEVASVDQHVLPHGELVVERVLLGNDPEAGADRRPIFHRVTTEDAKITTCRRRYAAEHAHGGGLPGPVRAEEAERFTLEKIKVDPVHRGEAAESLRQASGANQYLGHPMEDTWRSGWFPNGLRV